DRLHDDAVGIIAAGQDGAVVRRGGRAAHAAGAALAADLHIERAAERHRAVLLLARIQGTNRVGHHIERIAIVGAHRAAQAAAAADGLHNDAVAVAPRGLDQAVIRHRGGAAGAARAARHAYAHADGCRWQLDVADRAACAQRGAGALASAPAATDRLRQDTLGPGAVGDDRGVVISRGLAGPAVSAGTALPAHLHGGVDIERGVEGERVGVGGAAVA